MCSGSMGFLGGSVVKYPPANARDSGDLDLIPGWGRSPGGGNGNPLQYSCLENPMDRGAWRARVHGVAKSWTWLSNQHFHFHYSLSQNNNGRFQRQFSILGKLLPWMKFFSWLPLCTKQVPHLLTHYSFILLILAPLQFILFRECLIMFDLLLF